MNATHKQGRPRRHDRASIVEFVRKNPELTYTDIALVFHVHKSTISRAMKGANK